MLAENADVELVSVFYQKPRKEILRHLCFFVLCPDLPSGPHSYRLEELAYTRSGDKGDSANIGENK